jgi:L-iditol 2-dehydrogenase
MAELVAVPARILYRIPDGMSFEQAAMVEPVSIAFHAVRRAGPGIGDSALVIGCGIIGQFAVQAAKLAGCGFVAAVDLESGRLSMARRLGADLAVNAGSERWTEELRAGAHGAAGGRGFDLVIEAVGLEITVRSAMELVKTGGRTVLIGNVSPEVRVPLQRLVTGELDVLGSCASSGEYAACIRMISGGRIRVDPLISRRAPLSEGERWFQVLASGPDSRETLFKVLLDPTEGGKRA